MAAQIQVGSRLRLKRRQRQTPPGKIHILREPELSFSGPDFAGGKSCEGKGFTIQEVEKSVTQREES